MRCFNFIFMTRNTAMVNDLVINVMLVLALIILIPIAVVWDLIYTIVSIIYSVCTTIDKKGSIVIDGIFDRLWKLRANK